MPEQNRDWSYAVPYAIAGLVLFTSMWLNLWVISQRDHAIGRMNCMIETRRADADFNNSKRICIVP